MSDLNRTNHDPDYFDARRHAPSTARNRDAIADVLSDHLPRHGTVLEIASGSGEHALYFAALFPHLLWQPSDRDPVAHASISAWREAEPHPNLAMPLALDAASPDQWPHPDDVAGLLCINMVHISAWDATIGLFRGAAALLPRADTPLILYGPYLREGVETAPSNIAFDADLRRRNPDWGLRDVAAMDALAAENSLRRDALVDMPANNIMLVYRPL